MNKQFELLRNKVDYLRSLSDEYLYSGIDIRRISYSDIGFAYIPFGLRTVGSHPHSFAARLSWWFNHLMEDEFAPISQWDPAGLWRSIFLKPHKDRRDRYRLFAFFYLNGMRPRLALFWTLIHNTYDRSAYMSLLDAFKYTLSDHGREYLARNRVFIIEERRVPDRE